MLTKSLFKKKTKRQTCYQIGKKKNKNVSIKKYTKNKKSLMVDLLLKDILNKSLGWFLLKINVCFSVKI